MLYSKLGLGWVPQISFAKEEGERKLVVATRYRGMNTGEYEVCRLLYVDDKLVFNSCSGNDESKWVQADIFGIYSEFAEALSSINDPLTSKMKARLKRGGLK
ncbi:MAG TPA: hypothetical protein PKH07_06075 [bacterium]|nr:hypothetical protein [bacterium]